MPRPWMRRATAMRTARRMLLRLMPSTVVICIADHPGVRSQIYGSWGVEAGRHASPSGNREAVVPLPRVAIIGAGDLKGPN